MITDCCIKCLKCFPQQVYKKVKYILLKRCIIFPLVLLNELNHIQNKGTYTVTTLTKRR